MHFVKRERLTAPRAAHGAINFGYFRSSWWARLDVVSDQPVARYLEIGYPSLDSVELFVQRADGDYLRVHAARSVALQ